MTEFTLSTKQPININLGTPKLGSKNFQFPKVPSFQSHFLNSAYEALKQNEDFE